MRRSPLNSPRGRVLAGIVHARAHARTPVTVDCVRTSGPKTVGERRAVKENVRRKDSNERRCMNATCVAFTRRSLRTVSPFKPTAHSSSSREANQAVTFSSFNNRASAQPAATMDEGAHVAQCRFEQWRLLQPLEDGRLDRRFPGGMNCSSRTAWPAPVTCRKTGDQSEARCAEDVASASERRRRDLAVPLRRMRTPLASLRAAGG
jgi:hypothetical protein